MEQRYDHVTMVMRDGFSITEIAAKFNVSRQTIYRWLAKYEAGGLGALGEEPHRPHHVPHQMGGVLKVRVLDMRKRHPLWGPKRIQCTCTGTCLAPINTRQPARLACRSLHFLVYSYSFLVSTTFSVLQVLLLSLRLRTSTISILSSSPLYEPRLESQYFVPRRLNRGDRHSITLGAVSQVYLSSTSRGRESSYRLTSTFGSATDSIRQPEHRQLQKILHYHAEVSIPRLFSATVSSR